MPRAAKRGVCPHCGGTHAKKVRRCPVTRMMIGGDPELIGRTIADRYHPVRLLGDGGMGAVYKAADRVLRRFVALKLLHPEVLDNQRAVERFVREARASATIGHPNIIDVMDFGYAGRTPFLVMEYLKGQSLARVIYNERRLAIDRACRIATHTLTGLSAAHGRGILHRDLKPANLMLVSRLGDHDFVKICDFGFAALLMPHEPIDEGKRALTPARTLVGTPVYAAPERLRGDDRRDPRVDVYAVGVVLYEMLAGRRPFDAPTLAELSKMVRKEMPKPVREHRSEVPEELERVVARALAKRPDDRFENAEAFAEALVPFGGRPVPRDDSQDSDEFTMDLVRIRAREQARHDTGFEEEPTAIEGRAGSKRGLLDEQDTIPDDRAYRGRAILAVLRQLGERYGERELAALLKELPSYARRVFDAGIEPTSWVPHDAVSELLAQLEDRWGKGELRLPLEMGRTIGADLRKPLVESVVSPTPQQVLETLPEIGRRVMRGMRYRVITAGNGFGRIELVERGVPTLHGCVASLGFIERVLARAGGEQVEVTLLGCRALDDPKCLFDVSWL